MNQYSPFSLRLFLLAIGCFSMSGCQSDGRWSQWWDRDELPFVSARGRLSGLRGERETDTDSPAEIEPGFSAAPEEFNEYYDPYVEEPTDAGRDSGPLSPSLQQEQRRFDRVLPPLIPPSRTEAQAPNRNQRGGELQLPASAVSERLIKVLRSPALLFPGNGRGIYGRFRSRDSVKENDSAVPQTDGPIAQFQTRDKMTQVCQHNELREQPVCPVTLGLPEPLSGPPSDSNDSGNVGIADHLPTQRGIVQATPSSFKRPLVADPTGLPSNLF